MLGLVHRAVLRQGPPHFVIWFIRESEQVNIAASLAMLGVIHRSVLGLGPEQFGTFFRRNKCTNEPYATRGMKNRHDMQLEDIRDGQFLEIQRRSALGLVWVYNRLPGEIVATKTVSCFQPKLHELVKERVLSGCSDWRHTLDPRIRAYAHPLR